MKEYYFLSQYSLKNDKALSDIHQEGVQFQPYSHLLFSKHEEHVVYPVSAFELSFLLFSI